MRNASCARRLSVIAHEVRVVRAHHNGHAELRRLQRIVPARRNQAAADKSHAGQRIHRRQFADRVQQHNLAGSQRLQRAFGRDPIATAAPTDPRLLQQRLPLLQTAPDAAAQAPLPTARRHRAAAATLPRAPPLRLPACCPQPRIAIPPPTPSTAAWPRPLPPRAHRTSDSPQPKPAPLRSPAPSGDRRPSRSAPAPSSTGPATASTTAAASGSAATNGRRCARSPQPREFRGESNRSADWARTPSPPEPACAAAAHSDTRAPPTADRAGNKRRDSLRSARAPTPVRCAWWWRSTTEYPGSAASSVFTSRVTASTSPTETACSQISGRPPVPEPEASRLGTRPSRSRQPLAVFLRGRHPPQPPRRPGHERRKQGQVIEKENHAVPIALSPV